MHDTISEHGTQPRAADGGSETVRSIWHSKSSSSESDSRISCAGGSVQALRNLGEGLPRMLQHIYYVKLN